MTKTKVGFTCNPIIEDYSLDVFEQNVNTNELAKEVFTKNLLIFNHCFSICWNLIIRKFQFLHMLLFIFVTNIKWEVGG